MVLDANIISSPRQAVPAELGGRWIAWSADGLRIVADGLTLDECEAAASKAGELDPSFEKVPPSDVRIVDGHRR